MDKYESVSFALMAGNFWQLVANSADELVKSGNTHLFIYDEPGAPDRTKYKEHIKWIDINVAQPILFNFYHGIELSLKALLIAKKITVKKNHCLTKLLSITTEKYSDIKLKNFYSKYIIKDKLNPILFRFCEESNVTMDLYYQSLKYPESTKGNKFKHSTLHYNGIEGVNLFGEIKKDINEITYVIQNLISKELGADPL